MRVCELKKMLEGLDQTAVIDIASDEEGNSFGDISTEVSEGELLDGQKAYSLYPRNNELPEERYKE